MSASANMFNINISDHDVRLTFIDQRPKFLPDEMGRTFTNILVNDIVGEVVISQALFRQMLDMGDKLLDEHASKRGSAN